VLRNLYTKALWDNRRALIAWSVATSLVAMMYASFYPQMASGSMADAMKSVPQGMREAFHLDDVSSAAGYLQSSTFGVLVPLLAMFYGAATGTRMIAADEESGNLDLLLAYPLGRTRLVVQRFAALATGAVAIAAVLLLAMLVIRSGARLGTISVGEFAAQCLGVALLAIVFGALAVGLGAALGRGRAVVFGATAGAGVLGYAVNGFAPQIGAAWLQRLSPFHYYIGAEPLKNGLNPAHVAVLSAVSAILVTAGTWGFNHRDVAG
jgi:ABC-2 type transport system permease protein